MTTSVPSAVDLQGLTQLKYRAASEDPAALAEAAVQFEALFIGMMLETARDASLGDGLFDSSESRQYFDLMDQQVALDLAKSGGFGFGKLLIEQLSKGQGLAAPATSAEPRPAVGLSIGAPTVAQFPAGLPPSLLALGVAPTAAVPDAEVLPVAVAPTEKRPMTPEDFVARLWPEAAAAADKLGIEPRLLVAQAALETGWGGASPAFADGQPANNMFGIKAGSSWGGDRIAQWTIEHSGGVAERKREQFRAYPSTAASFADYVSLISKSPRYSNALEQAHDPEGYARAVTAAGYATDPDYAEKWLAIYRGERLDGAVRGLKPADLEPTTVSDADSKSSAVTAGR